MHTLIPHHENNQHNTPAPRDRRTAQPSSQKKHNYHSSNSSIPRNHKPVTTPRKKTHHYLQDTLFTQPRTRNAPPRQPTFLTYTKEHKIRKNIALQKKENTRNISTHKKRKNHTNITPQFFHKLSQQFSFSFFHFNFFSTTHQRNPHPRPRRHHTPPTVNPHQLSMSTFSHNCQHPTDNAPHRTSTPPATTAPAAAKQACQRQ